MARDREAEARPPALRACARSPWKKGVKSRSRVASGMPGPVSATSKRMRGPAGEAMRRRVRRDPALLRELDRVLEEVDDDLPEAARVAAHEGGQGRRRRRR